MKKERTIGNSQEEFPGQNLSSDVSDNILPTILSSLNEPETSELEFQEESPNDSLLTAMSSAGLIKLDKERRLAYSPLLPTEQPSRLTPTELLILEKLMEDPTRAFSDLEIVQHLAEARKQIHIPEDEINIKAHIHNLRRKMGETKDNPNSIPLITTVREAGHSLTEDPPKLKDNDPERTICIVTPEGDLKLDTNRLLAESPFLPHGPVKLTRKEASLLQALMKDPKKVLSNEELVTSMYGEGPTLDPGLIRVYVSNLRKKLGEKSTDSEKKLIHNHSRQGYSLTQNLEMQTGTEDESTNPLRFQTPHGELIFDPTTRLVRSPFLEENEPVMLTHIEALCLQAFMKDPKKVLSLEELLFTIHGEDTEKKLDTVRVTIYHLRKKLGSKAEEEGKTLIFGIHGLGYTLNPEQTLDDKSNESTNYLNLQTPYGELIFDPTTRMVKSPFLEENETVRLTNIEAKILEKIMSNPKQIFNSNRLARTLSPDKMYDEKLIRLHILKLRRKLGDTKVLPGQPSTHRLISFVNGGYSISAKQEQHLPPSGVIFEAQRT